MKTIKERFFDKVEMEPNSGCWIWVGGVSSQGYGRFKVAGKLVSSHRWSAQNLAGLATEELLVCHKCDNSSCVNPDHLFVGSHTENMQDCSKKGRISRKGRPLPFGVSNQVAKYPTLSSREVGSLLGISHSTVQYYRRMQ